MIRRSRPLIPALVVLLAATACDATPANVKEQGKRRRLAALGIETFDGSGTHRLAGVSATRIISVEPLDARALDGDTLGAGYRLLSMRCGACHQPPAPASKPAWLWEGTVARMRQNAREAGLMPMSAGDEAEVLRFLQRHAAGGP